MLSTLMPSCITPLLPFYSPVLIFRAGRLREGDNQVTKGGRVSMYLATLANKHSAGAASTATPGGASKYTRYMYNNYMAHGVAEPQ